MASPTTTRGSLLAAAGTAVASPAVPSPELLELIAAFDAIEADLDRFYSEVHNPAVEVNNAAVLQHQAVVDAIPHVEEFGGKSFGGEPVRFTSREKHTRTQAEHFLSCEEHGVSYGADWDETVAAARRFVEADDRRNAAVKELGEPPACPAALGEQEQAVLQTLSEARRAVSDFPARTLVDLQAKLSFLERDGGMDGEDLMPLVLADVARLIGKEG